MDEETGVEYVCHCDDENYVQVTIKEIGEYDMKGWLEISEYEDQLVTECPQCGNKEYLYREINKSEDCGTLILICNQCHCTSKTQL